ncbi:extracellular solute-binding protein [Legionella spiritensis]|uniref:extracellular solute-binding protein n=1 Tax=Legionella spiritensis TaxID=452 RepID=UPI000F6D158A|nr:extracellular solute-binding protein [Legionella spiritensis]VEG89625.1 glycerol-3-phosphate-binding periplasmic protein precursor [Legionella spiritensis]
MKRIVLFIILFIQAYSLAAKPVELVLWHSLAGQLGNELKRLIHDFNESQQDVVVKPVYKGDYIDSLTSFAAAFRAKQPPVLIQVFEVGTATMLNPKGIIKPADDIMIENGYLLPKTSFFPAVRDYYSQSGKLQALPFNTSVPVIFYNADVLAKAGYSGDNFPKTWEAMDRLAARLKQSGAVCAYSSAYPSWIQIESFSSLHGLPMTDHHSHKAIYNNQAVIRHLERLRRWQKQHYFEYGGRTSDATVLFTSGRCAMFSQSSGSYNSLAALVRFPVGVAALPLDSQASQKRYPNVAGGAALWAVSGYPPEVYRGVARFYAYLTQPENQLRWHQRTGYIPVGLSGVYKDLATRSDHPALRIARLDLSDNNRSDMAHSGPQNQIRTINDEAMEAIFSGLKTPKQAMDDAVLRANYTIMRFLRNTGSH